MFTLTDQLFFRYRVQIGQTHRQTAKHTDRHEYSIVVVDKL